MRRHGPRVLGVCRGILGHSHDAEDAFQATFLVLARKAASIRKRNSLGSWLHGVAYRVTRAQAGRRKHDRIETHALAAPFRSPLEKLSWGEIRALLYVELAPIPERFREPLVLCYLEGLTYDEAARRLQVPPATLKGRLQRGRDHLRSRLQRRGVSMPESGTAALAAQGVADKVPLPLLDATVKTALTVPLAKGTSAAAVLAAGVTGPLLVVNLKLVAAGVLLAVAIAGGAMQFSRSPARTEIAKSDPPPKVPPKIATDLYGDALPEGAVARLGTIRFDHGDGLERLHYTPDGKKIISVGGGWARIWDASSGRELNHFSIVDIPARAADGSRPSWDGVSALSPNGKELTLLGRSDKTVQVWDLETIQLVRRLRSAGGPAATSQVCSAAAAHTSARQTDAPSEGESQRGTGLPRRNFA